MYTFNHQIKLILADVDETIADVYTDASPSMINELSKLLKSGKVLALITGAGLGSVKERITDHIDPSLRHKIIIAHCSGAEIVGFDKNGQLLLPYYSVYTSKMNSEQQMTWRSIASQVIEQYQLKTVNPQKVSDFNKQYGNDPLTVMLADRGPQITLEFVNGYNLSSESYLSLSHLFPGLKPTRSGEYDLRELVSETFNQLLSNANLPVSAHLGGVFALDLILDGVSKTEALNYLFNNTTLLRYYSLPTDIASHPDSLEIWGDKFGKSGGSDRKMCMAVHPKTRAIDFRVENKQDIGEEFNIVLWDGNNHLQEGLLEYLQSSNIN
ncbi:MAG: hypothetical protein E6P95_02005 [Candidatus Moraniibacteriota bacterium]|nr:MAG: hypothetical protein E6P95_02005 [Candidatus Moranbacteria bacterium]